MQYASLMWDYDHGSLPKAFDGFFTKVRDIHSYRTLSSSLVIFKVLTQNPMAQNCLKFKVFIFSMILINLISTKTRVQKKIFYEKYLLDFY